MIYPLFTISITTKMKRRNFISTTILGALSANQLLASTPVESTIPNISKWFSQLLKVTNAKQRKRYFLTDKKLKNTYEAIRDEWSLSGYQALGENYFLCRDGELALFPIELQHTTLGQIDFAVLVFEKKKSNEWKSVKSLSGFNIEALVKSLNTFSADVEDVANCILPTQSTPEFTIKGYKTPKGHVYFDTRITDNKAVVNVEITINNEIVWNGKHDSEHSLS